MQNASRSEGQIVWKKFASHRKYVGVSLVSSIYFGIYNVSFSKYVLVNKFWKGWFSLKIYGNHKKKAILPNFFRTIGTITSNGWNHIVWIFRNLRFNLSAPQAVVFWRIILKGIVTHNNGTTLILHELFERHRQNRADLGLDCMEWIIALRALQLPLFWHHTQRYHRCAKEVAF